MINPFGAALELRRLNAKIDKLIEGEKRAMALDDSEMERAMLGVANVGKDDLGKYYSHCAMRKTMRSVFLEQLLALKNSNKTKGEQE